MNSNLRAKMRNVGNYTVVTTVYNDEESINNFIYLINNQTLIPQKIIITDGGSTDGTIEKINAIRKIIDIPITLIMGDCLNIPEGFNKGIGKVETPYILLTTTGNTYEMQYAEKLYYAIINENADRSYGLLMGQNNNEFSYVYNKTFLNKNKGIQLASNRGIMLRKTLFDRVGLFETNFIYAGEDTEFNNRLGRFNIKSVFVPNAKLYWKTPCHLKAFIKQTKYYTIAELQISKFKTKSLLYPFVCIFVVLSLLFVALSCKWYFFILYVFLLYTLLSIKKRTCDIRSLFLFFLYNMLRLYYILKNRKKIKTLI